MKKKKTVYAPIMSKQFFTWFFSLSSFFALQIVQSFKILKQNVFADFRVTVNIFRLTIRQAKKQH